MFDNSVLNAVTGLVFIFLLYSLFATALHEALANIFQSRANNLYKGIKSMLTDTNLKKGTVRRILDNIKCLVKNLGIWLKSWVSEKEVKTLYDKFYHHPIIKNYGENAVFSKPSYLTAENFSTILIDTIKNLDPAKELLPADFSMIKDLVYKYSEDDSLLPPKSPPDEKAKLEDRIINCETFKILNFHLNEAAGDLNVFKNRIEQWFNDSMDRVSGWYKRRTQFMLFIIGMFLAIGLNIDTIEISSFLSKNKVAAEKLADMGTAAVRNPSYKPDSTNSISKAVFNELQKEKDTVNTLLGLGWDGYKTDTAFMLSLDKISPPGWFTEKWQYIPILGKIASLHVKVYDSVVMDNTMKKYESMKTNDSMKQTPQNAMINHLQKNIFPKNTATFKQWYLWYKLDWVKFFGFFITAIAISLGAPFWFDLLNKFVNLRSAGKAVSPSAVLLKIIHPIILKLMVNMPTQVQIKKTIYIRKGPGRSYDNIGVVNPSGNVLIMDGKETGEAWKGISDWYYKINDKNEKQYYWGGGITLSQSAPAVIPVTQQLNFSNLELPLNKNACIRCAGWIDENFGNKCTAAVADTPFSKEILYAIACQEAALYWQPWINDLTADEILGRCVFDATGDVYHTRKAFPENTEAFIARYGQPIADELIAEANLTRTLRNLPPKQWVYAGYGIFQYDIQYILTDEAFFTQKKWYSIDDCLSKAVKELNTKLALHPNDMFNTIKAYNGSGTKAENYALNVFQFLEWIKAYL